MSKYLIITLLVTIVASAIVNAALPSDIPVCKRNEPNISECIKNAVLQMKGQLAKGIKALGVPALEPLLLSKLVLNFGTGFGAVANNLEISGVKDFEIKHLDANIMTDVFYIEISIPKLVAVGEYDVNGKIAGIPLKGKGPLSLTAKTVTGNATLHGKKVPRNGETLYWFSSMNLKLNIEDYEIELKNLLAGDPTIGGATNKILNEAKPEVLEVLLPALEKSLSELILLVANSICKHFTWEELFPES